MANRTLDMGTSLEPSHVALALLRLSLRQFKTSLSPKVKQA